VILGLATLPGNCQLKVASWLKLFIYWFENSSNSNASWSECFLYIYWKSYLLSADLLDTLIIGSTDECLESSGASLAYAVCPDERRDALQSTT